jgi:hypothetical protein
VRWSLAAPSPRNTTLTILRHRSELWINVGAANLTRPSLGDFNLTAAIELRLPARAAAAHALTDHFVKAWASAASYARFADESSGTYWRYRLLEAGGLAAF